MNARRSAVTARFKEHDLYIASAGDFTLAAPESCDAGEILRNPSCTLYSLDLERQEAHFVELPESVKLAFEPFYFIGQYRYATHVVSVSFEVFHALADQMEVDDSRLAFIYSVGRCGSTLVSKAFEAVPAVCSISEPDTLTQLVMFRNGGQMTEEQVGRFARDCIKFVCKPLAGSDRSAFWAIKFRSQCLEICDLLSRAFPAARNLYLTREPLSWLGSAYRAFADPERIDDLEYKQMLEDLFAAMYPLVRALRLPGAPMDVWKVWILNWIGNVETFQRLEAAGVRFSQADFGELKSGPETAIRRLFDYCGLAIDDWSPVIAALHRDSQTGSVIAQSEIGEAPRQLPAASRELARQLLVERGHLSA